MWRVINNFYLFGEEFLHFIHFIIWFYKGENSNQVKFNNLQPGTHLEWKYCLYRITVSQSVSLLRGPEITEVQHGLFSPSTTWSPLSYYLTLRLPLSIVSSGLYLFFIFLPPTVVKSRHFYFIYQNENDGEEMFSLKEKHYGLYKYRLWGCIRLIVKPRKFLRFS